MEMCSCMLVHALYALYVLICRYMQRDKYETICINKYAQICTKYAIKLQKYAKPHDNASCVKICKICTKYAFICKICQHDIYMQNMNPRLF